MRLSYLESSNMIQAYLFSIVLRISFNEVQYSDLFQCQYKSGLILITAKYIHNLLRVIQLVKFSIKTCQKEIILLFPEHKIRYFQYYIRMLKYHHLIGQPSTTRTAQFVHFLTLGSHHSVIQINPIISFSSVKVFANTRLNINNSLDEITKELVIVTGNDLLIGDKDCQKNTVVFNPKNITERNGKESSILYLRFKIKKANEEIQVGNLRLLQQKMIQVSNSLRVIYRKCEKNDKLSYNVDNKRILIFVKKGQFLVESTKQIISENECYYSRHTLPESSVLSDSEFYIFELDDK